MPNNGAIKYASIKVVGSHSPPQEGKATQGQKAAHYCMTKPATVSQKN